MLYPINTEIWLDNFGEQVQNSYSKSIDWSLNSSNPFDLLPTKIVLPSADEKVAVHSDGNHKPR